MLYAHKICSTIQYAAYSTVVLESSTTWSSRSEKDDVVDEYSEQVVGLAAQQRSEGVKGFDVLLPDAFSRPRI